MLIFKEKTDFGPTLTYYGTDIYIGWTERDGAQHISVGPVKQYGLNGSTFSGGFLPDKFSDRANGAATIATLTTAMGSNFAGENFLIACWAGTDTALNIGVVY